MTDSLFPRALFLLSPQTLVNSAFNSRQEPKGMFSVEFYQRKRSKNNDRGDFIMTSPTRLVENEFQSNPISVLRAYKLDFWSPYTWVWGNNQELPKPEEISQYENQNQTNLPPPKHFKRTAQRKLTINVLKKRKAPIIKRKWEQNNLLKIKKKKKRRANRKK